MGVDQGHIVTIGTCNLGRCDEWRRATSEWLSAPCDPVERTPQTLTHGEGRGKREADSDGRLGSE